MASTVPPVTRASLSPSDKRSDASEAEAATPPRFRMPADNEQPRARTGRVIGIDLARGLALLGMFAVHVNLFGEGDPLPGWLQWILEQPSGRASVLFVTLAGVSLALLRGRGAQSAEPSPLRRRGALLVVGGLLLHQTVWPASILEHYGILFLVAPFLLRRTDRELLGLGALGLIGGPLFQLFVSPNSLTSSLTTNGVAGWLVETTESIVFSGTYPLVVWIGFFWVGI